ncbi:MAG: ABC transporter substrate-binding protein [Ignavibacteriaceae bacterium]
MVKFKYLFLIILFLPGFKTFARSSDDSAKVNTEFSLALDLYNSKQFDDAQKAFNKLSGNDNPKTTISFLFDAKSLLQLNQFQRAEETLKKFLADFPLSAYSGEARLMMAKIYLDKKNYDLSFEEILKIISSTKSSYYLDYAKSSGEKLALNYLSTQQIRSFYDSASSKKVPWTSAETKPYLLFLLGKSYLNNGDIESAKNSFNELIKQFPQSDESAGAIKLNENIANQKQITSSTHLIAVLLPLDKPSESLLTTDASHEILEGVKFAVSGFNDDHQDKIGLLIKNTGRSQAKIDSIKKDVDSLSSLKVIIGPIYSDEVKETLEAFKENDVPIISPTATDDGLTELYPNFFQANPSFTMRGKIVAEYIYYVENKRRMAILNSEGSYSSILAGSFKKEFEKLGGKILVRETFKPGSIDLSKQVSKIAKDSSKLQGVYLPLTENRDVPSILSQFLSSNLNMTVYGNQDWLLAKGFESFSSLSDKLTFSSDYFLDYNDSTFRQFSKRFFSQTGIDVSRNVLYGYDITKYILSFLTEQNISRSSLKAKLESGIIFRGFHNNIYFDKERINKFLNIVRYKDGKFELIDRFKAGN